MLAITAQVAMLMAVFTSTSPTYEIAFKKSAQQQKPLLVLVGAPWCPACRTMKDGSLPSLEKKGDLKQVVYATVNADNQAELARRLMDGNSIPQLILYTPTERGWQRAQLTGAYEPTEIQRFLQREIAAAQQAAAQQKR